MQKIQSRHRPCNKLILIHRLFKGPYMFKAGVDGGNGKFLVKVRFPSFCIHGSIKIEKNRAAEENFIV